VKGGVGHLLAGTLLFWIAASGAGALVKGSEVLLPSVPALLLCLVPAALTLWWATLAARASIEAKMLAFVGGTALRMAVAVGGALVLYFLVPFCHQPVFWLWVILFYLFTLGLETALVLRLPQPEGAGSADRSPS
jgi:hypothetical protein